MTSRPHPTTHHGLIAALLIGTALCALAVFPRATTARQDPAEGDYVISIYPGNFFVYAYANHPNPGTVLEIPVGATVKWTMRDIDNDHSVTSDDGTFDSGVLAKDSPSNTSNNPVYTRTFTEPGTFTYHDSLHPEMVGTIIVTGDVVVFR